MPFDLEGFRQAKFKPRTDVVKLDPTIALAKFFGDDPTEWTVRGLSGNEVHSASEAAEKQKARKDVAAALAAAGSSDRVAAIRESLGLSAAGDAPGEMVKRMEMFVMGSVSPKVELPDAVRFAEAFPVEFIQITSRISLLTGQGFDLVKPAAASPLPPISSQACDLPSSEAATSTSTDPT